jgi:integrase
VKLVERCNKNRQVAPVRVANAEMRSREYLTPAEIEKLIKAAKDGRWGLRDACLIVVAYRHGLRGGRPANSNGRRLSPAAPLHLRRAKGKQSVHPIRSRELRVPAMRSNVTFVPMTDKNDSSTYSYLAPTI